jgi:FG-GAP-like repeat
VKNQDRSLRVAAQSVGLGWLFVLLTSTMMLAQTNPVPLIYLPLAPMSAAPGGAQFTLTVNGANFVPGATLNWGKTVLETTFVSASQLTAVVPSTDLATATTALITVTSPAPGGGTSNSEYFTVTNPQPALDLFGSVLPVNVGSGGTYPTQDYGEVAADLNGDGNLDLVYLDESTSTVVVLLGNGDGTFQSPRTFPVFSGAGAQQAPIIAADFNGDGKLDLAVPDTVGNAIDILLGNGDGTFQTQIVAPTATGPVSVTVADFNRDGKLDLAVGTGPSSPTASGVVSVLLGNGDGTFQTHVDYGGLALCTHDAFNFPSAVTAVAAGDFNNDGFLDIVGITSSGYPCEGFLFFPGNGNGTFGTLQTGNFDVTGNSLTPLGAPPTLGLAFGGEPTICTWCMSGAIFTGNGDGTFTLDQQTSPAIGGADLASGDFNGDGYLDLAVTGSPYDTCASPLTLCIFLGSEAGSFTGASITFIPTLQQTGLIAGDFNNDGKMDFASTSNSQVEILMQGTSPYVVISPTSLTSNNPVIVGTTDPNWGSGSLTNGELPLTISSMQISGPNAGDFSQTNTCGSGLAANANCGFNVSFTPSAQGTRTATLYINDNGYGNPQTVSLSGVGGPTTVSFSPSSVTFPAQYVGTSGLPQTVTVTNNGTTALIISSVNTSIADFGTLSNCSNAVPPGANCTIGVFFDPTTSGTRNGTLIVTDNFANSPQSIPLTGAGQDFSMAPSGSPTATVSPGQTANYTVAVAPAGGFKQTVSLSCSGAPAGSTCSVPSSVTLDGSSSTPVTVTVTTATTSGSLIGPSRLWPAGMRLAMWLGFCGLPLVVLGASKAGRGHRRRALYALAFACLFSLGIASSACGGGNGGGGNGGGGVAAGTYNLTVTGSFTSGSSSLKHAANLTLVVQ